MVKFQEREFKCVALRHSFIVFFPFFSDRIRLYKSDKKGSELKKVAKNIPEAKQLIEKFKGGTSKRVYIILRDDDKNGGTNTRMLTQFSFAQRSLKLLAFLSILYLSVCE